MKLVKVEDRASLSRDLNTGAIINTNQEEYQAYLNKKNKILKEKEKIQQQDAEINNIKQELNEIKQLLYKIVQNGNNK